MSQSAMFIRNAMAPRLCAKSRAAAAASCRPAALGGPRRLTWNRISLVITDSAFAQPATQLPPWWKVG